MQYFYMFILVLVFGFMHIVQSDSDELELSSESIEAEETSELPLAYGSPSDSSDNKFFTSNYQYFDRRNDESPPPSSMYPQGPPGPMYPESPQTPDEVKSSPGCPEPVRRKPYVYYGNPGRCYITGEQGPCPENMRLFAQRSSAHGFCDCNCEIYFESTYHSPRSYCSGRTRNGVLRTLAYVRKWGSCQPIFDQSYCPTDQWLVFDDDPKLEPICARRMCPAPQNEREILFFDYSTGTCHTVGDSCKMTTYPYRGDFGIPNSSAAYRVQDSDWTPVCNTSRFQFGSGQSGGAWENRSGGGGIGGSIRNTACPVGQVYSRIRGTCVNSSRIRF